MQCTLDTIDKSEMLICQFNKSEVSSSPNSWTVPTAEKIDYV